MDAVVWMNVGLGIIWATLFVYLNNLRKRVWYARILLQSDYLYVANRLYKLHTIWGKVADLMAMYRRYNLSPEDKVGIAELFKEVSDIMEEENGEESLREGRRNQVPVK